MYKQRALAIRVIAMILIIVCVFPINVMAMETRASDYLTAYTAYIYPAGWGKVQIWFEVDGTGYMDEIGALQIKLYESTDNETWTWIKTYQHVDYADMLAYDDFTHMSHVEHNGTIGRYYKAYVCVWAGKDGDGDTRYFWTPAKKATLFAA